MPPPPPPPTARSFTLLTEFGMFQVELLGRYVLGNVTVVDPLLVADITFTSALVGEFTNVRSLT
jgi:hypothetical protein